MKENKYDDEIFFTKYAGMLRSQKGLEGAGEWSELRKILPDFAGRKVLDLGCGYGWHCKYASDKGATSILGVDISRRMLDKAAKINSDSRITYRCSAMEDLDFPASSFDIVLSSLALHYVKDYKELVARISRWLEKNGKLVFSVEHPVFTSYGTEDWFYDENGKILHFPIDNYYHEGRRETIFLGEKVIKYHRTLTTYLNTLLINGFEIENIIEPMPPENMLDIPGMKDEMRRPMMLLVSARKE